MGLQSLGYFVFLPVVAGADLALPKRWQNPFLLAASLLFCAWSLPDSGGFIYRLLPALVPLAVFLISYLGGLALERASSEAARKRRLALGVGLLALILFLFKYWDVSPLPTLLDGTAFARLAFPLGVSFYVFAAIGYLVDLFRGKLEAEHSAVRLALFLLFFGTLTQGPICRAGQILPQLQKARRFEAGRTVRALRLFAAGLFKKVAVADVLGLFVDAVLADAGAWSGSTLLAAALAYTVQLYLDFSGYSDMARASGLALGLELPLNFHVPFWAASVSAFWKRWHISLSGWLHDYLYLPLKSADLSRLTGGRAARVPVRLCIFLTFLFSGIWHGNTAPYFVWGVFEAVKRVAESRIHVHLGRPAPLAEQPLLLRGAKRLAVFGLWAAGMQLFAFGAHGLSLQSCLASLARWFTHWQGARLLPEMDAALRLGFYDNRLMVLGWFGLAAAGLCTAAWLDFLLERGGESARLEEELGALSAPLRWGTYYLLVLLILAGLIVQSGGFGGGVSFAYANY